VFRLILHEMLATTRGALAALFLDYEGETVELVCDRDLNDHDLRILGAYQGIFLTRLRELCGQAGAGQPQRFKIEFANNSVLSFDVKDGYYVVLLVDATASEGVAWRKLERCRERLLEEM
jgi:predicted regulator of Ras-like GTPase activity (Roadblock/LC7/MglB family)